MSDYVARLHGKLDTTVNEIVKHTIVPSADQKFRKSAERFIKSHLLMLLNNIDKNDVSAMDEVICKHFQID